MIDNLKAFAAVIDCKSLTKAASRLFLTQSAISRRIQQLEEALGGTLLDRTQRPPSCTALGQRVYEQSLPILRAADDLMTLTRQDAAPTGTVKAPTLPLPRRVRAPAREGVRVIKDRGRRIRSSAGRLIG